MAKQFVTLLIVVVFAAQISTGQEGVAPVAPAAETSAENPPAEKAATPKPKRSKRLPRRASTPKPTLAATPAPTPRPGFFQRMFGRERRSTPAPVATPTPRPTPAPTPRKRRAAVMPTPQPGTAKPAPTDPSVTPPPAQVTPPPRKNTKIKNPASSKNAANPPAEGDPEAQEKGRYEQAKAKALEDSDIRDLKNKADGAANEEEGRAALRAYNKALFEKMRGVDPSLKERIDRMEAGVLKRLGE